MAETSIPLVVKVWAGSEAHDFDYISRILSSARKWNSVHP